MESSISSKAASQRYYNVFQQGCHLKFAGQFFTAVLRTLYAESQDLAKRKLILVNRNLSSLAKLAEVIFGLEGSQKYVCAAQGFMITLICKNQPQLQNVVRVVPSSECFNITSTTVLNLKVSLITLTNRAYSVNNML